jgi:hypothetical protein
MLPFLIYYTIIKMARGTAVADAVEGGARAAAKALPADIERAVVAAADDSARAVAGQAKAASGALNAAAGTDASIASNFARAPSEIKPEDIVKAAAGGAQDIEDLSKTGRDISQNNLTTAGGDGKNAKNSTNSADADGLTRNDPGFLGKIYKKVSDNLPNFIKKYPLTCTGVVASCITAGIMVDATDESVFNIKSVKASSTAGNIIIEFTESTSALAAEPWSINPNDYVKMCMDLPMLNPPLIGIADKSVRVVSVPSDYTIEVEVGSSYKLLNSINCTYSGCAPSNTSPSSSTSPVTGNCGSFTAYCTFRNAFAYIFTQAAAIPAAILVAAAQIAGQTAGGLLGGLGIPSWGIITIIVFLVLSCIVGSVLSATQK